MAPASGQGGAGNAAEKACSIREERPRPAVRTMHAKMAIVRGALAIEAAFPLVTALMLAAAMAFD